MRRRSQTGTAALIATLALLAPPAGAKENPGQWTPGPQRYEMPADPERQTIVASDGTKLAASVYYPIDPDTDDPAERAFPVVLSITPYGKDVPGLSGATVGDAATYVTRGYIFVLADVRGTGDSEGRFQGLGPREVADNVKVVRWAARLPRSTGKVGMVGGSYLAFNQLATAGAVGRGSALKAIFPIRAHTDFYRDLVVPGGIFNAVFDVPYGLAAQAALHLIGPFFGPQESLDVVNQLADRVADTYEANLVPLIQGGFLGGDYAYYEEYWRERSLVPYIRRIPRNHVAVFADQAWFDIWPRASALVYTMLQNAAAGRSVFKPMRRDQRPDPRFQTAVEAQTHLSDSSKAVMLSLEWFDTWLKGRHTRMNRTRRPFRGYEVLGGRWIESPSWPPPGVRVRTFYFGPGRTGSAPASRNDGSLGVRPRSSRSTDSVQWIGTSSPCARMNDQEFVFGGFQAVGNYLGMKSENPCAFDDRTQHLSSLTYTTPPLRKDMTVAGPVGVDLYATATTDQTELIATLGVVTPDGASRPLATGDLLGSLRQLDRGRSWRLGGRIIAPYHPFTRRSERPVPRGSIVRYQFEIPGMLARIAAGNRLRITLATSMTPYLQPKATDQARLLGGRYEIQRSPSSPSAVHVPLVRPADMHTSRVNWGPCSNDC